MREFTGYVYFVGCKVNGFVKIGMTKDRDVSKRISAIQTGCPFPLKVMGKIECRGVRSEIVEKDLHNVFKIYRKEGEWFSFTGFLAAFVIDYFSDQEEVVASGVKRDHNQMSRSWRMHGLRSEPINKAVKAFRASDPESSVICGLEAMLAESMKYVAELEATIDAVQMSIDRQQRVIDSVPQKRRGTASDGYTIDLIARNFGEAAKVNAARVLSEEYDWKDFFECGNINMMTPEEFGGED